MAARSTDCARRGLALVATAFVWAIRVGRELYGRPDVPAIGYVEIALTCVVGAVLVYGLVNREPGARVFTAFFVGFGALYEGLTMLPVLTHAVALNALPTTVARVAEVLALGAGVAALTGCVLGQLEGGDVNVRLLAALIALAAGAAAVVLVIALLQSTPGLNDAGRESCGAAG